MQNLNYNTLKVLTLLLSILSIFSCTKESSDMHNLNETIIVRHKKADMPAYVHGNASEKVFLIILHGGPGGTGLQYRVNTIKSEIEKNNAVVYFDQRGSGSSQGTYSKKDVTVDLMAEDVLALVKVLKTKYGNDSRFFLMGHSWGGTLGLATLLKNQDDFLGWINVDGMHDPKDSYQEYKVELKKKAEEQIALGNSIKYWNDVITLVQNVAPTYNDEDFGKLNRESHNAEDIMVDDHIIYKPKFDGASDDAYNLMTLLWNTYTIQKILGDKGLFSTVSYTDRLHEIKIPSLVLWGKHDLIVPTSNSQEAYDKLGSQEKEIFIFNKSAHSPMFNEPALFSKKVIDFINKYKL